MEERPLPGHSETESAGEAGASIGAGEAPAPLRREKTRDDNSQRPFPIVGIGASAGGLEALEQFLRNIPPHSGMAFVIVQHLDPSRKDMMVELLQRATMLPVIQVRDRLRIKPEHVYVIPPNKDMSILSGVLHLFSPVAPRGLRLPINFFFKSLANDLLERSLGVILSGMGSDGTLGLQAIKEKGGAGFVQAPASAKYDGMPRSAIEAGCADVVAGVEELPGKITAYLRQPASLARPDLTIDHKTQSALEKVLILLRMQTHHDFSAYKKSTIYRRIERRMGIHQIERITNYVSYLQENPQETELLFKELLIGVTSFFRDPSAWDLLKSEVVAGLVADRKSGSSVRAWTPGCSTGEEAFSLAMIYTEAREQAKQSGHIPMQIFATDLDQDAIDKARQAIYPDSISADVSPERLERFFIKEDKGYRVIKEIREMVIFARQDLVMDAPFTHIDVLICRNLLIYLDSELQKRLIPLFHYSLNPEGVLFLGNAETIGGKSEFFTAVDAKQRIYRRVNSTLAGEKMDFPGPFFPLLPKNLETLAPQLASQTPIANLQALADHLLLQRFSPAAVLVSEKGDILYINGRTGRFLEPAAGKANWNILAMAREGLRYELGSAFQKALREKASVTLKRLVVDSDSGKQSLNLTILPLTEPETLRGLVMIVFSEVSAIPKVKVLAKNQPAGEAGAANTYQAQLSQELQQVVSELQATREEIDTSQEELKSANEELQSTNEEMQSTNEELTTSKEEMQSLNEELQTVNHELQARVEELSRSNNDMKNLLNSTNIAILFLDDALNVRRFTSHASQIIRLIPGDVGRPITDIASDLVYPGLTADVEEVLRSLIFKEKPIQTREGPWYSVRIMPYRTFENRIDGVVITYTDISISKNLEVLLHEKEKEMRELFMRIANAFAYFETELSGEDEFSGGRFVFVNDVYERLMGVSNEEVEGKTIQQVWPDIDAGSLNAIGRVVMSGAPGHFEMKHTPSGKRFRCQVFRPDGNQGRFCVILEDISNLKKHVLPSEPA